MGLEKLFEFIENFWQSLLPFCILAPYQAGTVARLGQERRDIGPGGFHWIIPFGIEEVYKEDVVMRTTHLGNQTYTLGDGKMTTLYGVVLWRIDDIRKATMRVDNLPMTVKDSFYAVVGRNASSLTFDEIRDPDTWDAIAEACQEDTQDYGVTVLRFSFAEVCEAIPLRLLNDN